MCAINGFNFKDEALIYKMNEVTRHRGPDGSGVFCDGRISLGHNRLSIIDLSKAASQPMMSNNGHLAIVFNGEIYNFLELKKELSADYQFRSSSDTEVILAAYQKWGEECVSHLSGIFAFAIWDNDHQVLFLARDHVGVKPLYYFWDGKKFIFSSEIKAILEHGMSRVLDHEAFNHYLRVLYVPEPLTMFAGIRKFPPASSAVLKDGVLTIKKYWQVKFSDARLSASDTARVVREQVLRSVQRQLISDRPLGIYLSGGIDSSIVLDAVMSVRGSIDTFSVGFDLTENEQRDKFNADFYLARQTAQHYGANHNEVLLSSRDVLDSFEEAVWYLDEPISNPTALSMMKLAKFAKTKVDVVFGGDGGDELFGGYDRYRLSLMASYYQKLPNSLRKILSRSEKLQKLNTPSGVDRFSLFMFQKDDILRRVVTNEFLSMDVSRNFFAEKYFKNMDDTNFEKVFMNTDRQSWLTDESLTMSDKMSMSAGLEARVPLLDLELVELAARIPLKYKISPFNTKIIFKEAFRGRIPDFLFGEPKRGWFSPAAKWLRHKKIYEMAEDVLSEKYYSETAILFAWSGVREVLERHRDKNEYNLTILWALLTFQLWAKKYNITI